MDVSASLLAPSQQSAGPEDSLGTEVERGLESISLAKSLLIKMSVPSLWPELGLAVFRMTSFLVYVFEFIGLLGLIVSVS